MAMRDRRSTSRAAFCATAHTSHLRRSASLVDENQMFGVKIRLGVEPSLTPHGNVVPRLLVRVRLRRFYGMARPLSSGAMMAIGTRRRGLMTKTPIAVLGIDLGKNSCSLAGMDAAGALVMRKRMTRDAIVTFATNFPACAIAMEACCGAHFPGRTLALYGRVMSPEYVQPYVKLWSGEHNFTNREVARM